MSTDTPTLSKVSDPSTGESSSSTPLMQDKRPWYSGEHLYRYINDQLEWWEPSEGKWIIPDFKDYDWRKDLEQYLSTPPGSRKANSLIVHAVRSPLYTDVLRLEDLCTPPIEVASGLVYRVVYGDLEMNNDRTREWMESTISASFPKWFKGEMLSPSAYEMKVFNRILDVVNEEEKPKCLGSCHFSGSMNCDICGRKF